MSEFKKTTEELIKALGEMLVGFLILILAIWLVAWFTREVVGG